MRALLCLAILLAAGVQTADAQCIGRWCRDGDRHRRTQRAGPPELGVRGGYDFGDDSAMAGVQVRIPIIPQLFLLPSADVFFDDSPSEWQANLDLAVRPRALGGIYGGAGVAFLDREFTVGEDGETQVGYNIFAGLDGGQILETRLRPYVEARWSGVDDYEPFRLVVGGNVPLR
jgi:hypothetical protein